MSYNLEKFQMFADRRILRTIYPSLFSRVPLVAVMLAMGGSKSNLDRPGALGLIAGNKLPRAKREDVDGSVYTDVPLLVAKSGGATTRGARDANPAVERSQDQNLGSARFYWWRATQPLKVWHTTTLLSGGGKFRIFNALATAVDMGREELVDYVATQLWTGAPSTYNPSSGVDLYDGLPGVLEAMHATNSYGNINRSDATKFVDGRHPWAGNRITAARNATVDLVDEANDYCQLFGDGVNLVLTTRAIYRALKKEALGKGGAIIHNGVIPGYGTMGYKRDSIMYGNTVISYDPKCSAGHVACFTTADWCVELHPKEKFTCGAWRLNQDPGQDEAYTSNINAMMKVYTTKPVNNALFTNVSVAA